MCIDGHTPVISYRMFCHCSVISLLLPDYSLIGSESGHIHHTTWQKLHSLTIVGPLSRTSAQLFISIESMSCARPASPAAPFLQREDPPLKLYRPSHQPSLIAYSVGSLVLYHTSVFRQYKTHDPLENTTRSG